MQSPSFLLSDELAQYVRSHTDPIDDLERRLIAETAPMKWAGFQIGPEQGRFLSMLVRLSGARAILEIGTFTGYSSLCMARALPDDGRLLTCDVSVEWTNVARRYWEEAGVAHRIELRLGPAVDTLEALEEPFDLAFIDADKESYVDYFELVVPRLRSGGLLLADNVLWGGRVVEPSDDALVRGIRRFNDLVAADPRVETLVLPVFDGLTMAVKH